MRDFGPGHPLVFSHIPKTGGTSLKTAIRRSLQPEVFVRGLDRSLFGGYDDVDTMRPKARATIYLAPDQLPADATLVAGHISPTTTMARYPGADHITFLRTPQVRVISQWLHSRALSEFDLRQWGPAAEAFRIGRLPLRDYLQHPMIAPNIDNTSVRFLVWPSPLAPKTDFIAEADDDELLAAAIARLDCFAHVDVVENPVMLAGLSAWLGRELDASRLNERTSMPPRTRPDLLAELDDPTRELLDHRVRIDSRLWEHVAGRVLPEVDARHARAAALKKAIDRYVAMLTEPAQSQPVRRTVERVYDLQARLNLRRSASR